MTSVSIGLIWFVVTHGDTNVLTHDDTNVLTHDDTFMFLFVAVAADMYYNEHVVALIGPGCTYALDPVGRLAAYWNIPLITGPNIFEMLTTQN